jgi:hypothetical protein
MDTQKPGAGAAFDLFGNKLEPLRDRRGRPSYKKTKENQDFVAVRAATGWTQAMIAEALVTDEKTLRKNFSRELKYGHLILDGLCLDVLLRGTREGHTPSVKALQARLDRVATGEPRRKAAEEAEETQEQDPAPSLGKKELRLDGAREPMLEYGEIYDRIRQQ